MTQQHDVVVVGGGPGGYAAALYGASAGLDVALVEGDRVGGTCLNRGCIPAKALLQAAEVFRTASHASDFGIVADGGSAPRYRADWPKVNARSRGVVDRLVGGLSGLLKKRKVTVVNGWARLTPDGNVAVGDTLLSGRGVILANGSVPRSIPGFEIDGERIITSDHATNTEYLPERVAVVGGGVIGTEFASVYTDVGVDTTLLEALPGLGVLPIGPDQELVKILARSLTKRGTKIHGGAKVSPPEATEGGLLVTFEDGQGSHKIEVDHVLVAIGRRPLTENCGLDEAGVAVDQKGFIEVDHATLQTTRRGVYAVGDAISTPGLAHVAYAEAIVAVNGILGERQVPVDYGRVPWVVYSHPEVAWAGMTEDEAKAAGRDVVVSRYHFAGNGRALIIGDTEGIVKVVADRDGPILGVHIVGPWASELVSEGYLAVNWQALPVEVGSFVHAHPSLAEALGEATLALTGRSLHG